MKLSKIEPYLAQMVSSDKSSLNTKHQYRPDYAEEVVERDERYIIDHYLYTEEQMQEYAKECVREAIILNSGGAVSDDMIKRAIDSVFTEDTKND